ncbi:MAG: hypothetical protein V4538_15375 [Bacteroidota bacterium]
MKQHEYYNGRESDCGNYPETEFKNEYGNPPVQPHYKVPKWHKRMYIIDWCICIVVAGVIVWGVLEIIDNYLKH